MLNWLFVHCKGTGCLEGFHFQNYQKNLKFLEEQTKKPLLQLRGNRVLKYTCYNLCEPAGSKLNIKFNLKWKFIHSYVVPNLYVFFLLSVSKKWNVFPGCSLPHNESELVVGLWSERMYLWLYFRLLKLYDTQEIICQVTWKYNLTLECMN